MDCQACIDSLTAFLDDELSAPEKEVLQTHLTQCRPCRQEHESLLDSYQWVDQLTDLEMDSTGWTRIHSEITHLAPGKPAWVSPFQFLFGSRWIPVAAGTLGVAILSFFFLAGPKAEMQDEFQVYLEQREQMVIRRPPPSPLEGIREITTDLPNPFTVSYDSSQSNPFTQE